MLMFVYIHVIMCARACMQVFTRAKDAIDGIFFVGIQEAYDISVEVLLREFKMDHLNITVIKERDQSNAGIAAKKKQLKDNKPLMERAAIVNKFDIELYKYGKNKHVFVFVLLCMFVAMLVWYTLLQTIYFPTTSSYWVLQCLLCGIFSNRNR